MGAILVPQGFVGTNYSPILKLYITGEEEMVAHMAGISFLRSPCYDCGVKI